MTDMTDIDAELRRRFDALVQHAEHDSTVTSPGRAGTEAPGSAPTAAGVVRRLRGVGRPAGTQHGRTATSGSQQRGRGQHRSVLSLRNLAAVWIVLLLVGAGLLVSSQLPKGASSHAPRSRTVPATQPTPSTTAPTTTSTLPSTTTTTIPARPTNTAQDAAEDEFYVAGALDDCVAFTVDHKCPQSLFQLAETSDGSRGNLYAVTAIQTTGDSCQRESVWFFDGTKPITLAADLPPMDLLTNSHAPAGHFFLVVGKVRAVGAGELAVPFAVSTATMPEGVSCASVGNAGTDTYVYRWDGTTLAYVSGEPPASPRFLGFTPPASSGPIP